MFGAGLDQPLALYREGYHSLFPDRIHIVPHANWRGDYDMGTYDGLLQPLCKQLPPVNPGDHEEVESELDSQQDTVPRTPHYLCMVVEWPAAYLWMSHLSRENTPAGPRSWTGSLIQNKRDMTGLLYMRNRYYDPQTGRFTQEDPIGLAGGLNAYGFADGDPVSYSDPHGLFTCLGDPGCPKEFSSVQTFSRTFGVDAAFLPFGGNAQVGFAIDTNGQSSLFATAGPTMDFGIDAGFQLSGQDRPVSEVAATFNRSNEFTFTYTVGAASGSAIVDMEPGKLVGVAVGPRGGLALQMSQTAIGVATRPRNIAEENRKTCRELRRFLCFGSRL